MKYLIIFIAIISVIFTQSKDDLYILYKDSPCIKIENIGKEKKAHFVYKMYYKDKIEQNLHLIESKKSDRDTLSLSKLKGYELKDYNWLRNNFVEYYHFSTDSTPRSDPKGNARFYNLNKFFKNVYIVRVDSTIDKAIVYQVEQNYISDYEGWNINLKDSSEQ